jgi:fatty acid desaturase
MSNLSSYSAAEVALHNSSSDCWVIIHDNVYDVSSFLPKHPGGAAALSKRGRAGCDVSLYFEQIGHSDQARLLLKDFYVGGVSKDMNANCDEQTSLLSKEDVSSTNEREHAIMWHAQRRQDIIRDHPEIQTLFGTNPFTCVIGMMTVIVHYYVCILVQRTTIHWLKPVFLAATVGAICKMFQFAVNHDICHGTAGVWLEKHDIAKRCAMQVLTLPSIGGSMHTYYEFQHVGHHSSLGTQSYQDVQGVENVDCTVAGSGRGDGDIFTLHSLGRLMFFPEGDGDMFALGNLSMGRLLESWGSVAGRLSTRIYVSEAEVRRFHSLPLVKVVSFQVIHFFHHLMMTLSLFHAILIPPIISLPAFIFPERVSKFVVSQLRSRLGRLREDLSPECEELLITMVTRLSSSVGVHAYLWAGMTWWLLYGMHMSSSSFMWSSCFNGFVYLYLSELFLYGFMCHPFMGYFLGVHRSRGRGFTSSVTSSHTSGADAASARMVEMGSAGTREDAGCQPTMSTYSFWAAVCSMNLTHHVEHHDFPQIPWNRLPQVTRLAPEYYETLEQSPGFCATIYRWILHSEGWSYACQ